MCSQMMLFYAIPGKDAEKHMVLEELNKLYLSAIQPLESLYKYSILGISPFTGILFSCSEYNCILIV